MAGPDRLRLVLASSSPRRRELLADAGFEFDVIAPSAEAERGLENETDPVRLVTELATKKAADVVFQLNVRPRRETTLLLAADTVAECADRILGKPADEQEARDMLRALAGREHRVLTGVCLQLLEPGPPSGVPRSESRVETTSLIMDRLNEEQISAYLRTGMWRGKAGAFGYQDNLGWVHVLHGSPSNVVGLPLEAVRSMLTEFGFEPTGKSS